MRNRYSGQCCICGKVVPVSAGHFEAKDTARFPKTYEKIIGKWALRCKSCVGVGHPADGDIRGINIPRRK